MNRIGKGNTTSPTPAATAAWTLRQVSVPNLLLKLNLYVIFNEDFGKTNDN